MFVITLYCIVLQYCSHVCMLIFRLYEMSHLSFHYILWGNFLWYTSALHYNHVSGTNYAHKLRYLDIDTAYILSSPKHSLGWMNSSVYRIDKCLVFIHKFKIPCNIYVLSKNYQLLSLITPFPSWIEYSVIVVFKRITKCPSNSVPN